VRPQALLILAALLSATAARAGGGPENVLVVVNDLCEESVALGRFYVLKRDLPRHHIVHVRIPGAPPKDPKKPEPFSCPEAVPGGYEGYRTLLEEPVKRWLADHPRSPITTLALTRGIPIVSMTRPAPDHPEAPRSTTHLLALLGAPDDLRTAGDGQWGFKANPYFRSDASIDPRSPLPGAPPLYSVVLLDAMTLEDAKGMITLSLASDAKRPDGTACLARSSKDDPRGMYNGSYPDLAAALKILGLKAETLDPLDTASPFAPREGISLLQFGQSHWDPAFPAKNRFQPGALVDNLTSYALAWGAFAPGRPVDQTPMTRFLSAGATVIHGCVREPTTGAWDSGYLHLRRYAEGYNAAESFTMAHPWLPWMNLVCGDPLTQPYALRPAVTLEEGPGTKPPYRLKVSAKASREGAAIRSLTLYVDGVKAGESTGGKAGFELKDFDPAVNGWRVVAEDDSKFRTQGFLASPPLKGVSYKISVKLVEYVRGKAFFRVSASGPDPVFTFVSPDSKEKVGTRKGVFTLTFEDPSVPHAVEVWIMNGKDKDAGAILNAEVPGKRK